jgi:Fe-S cluster biogenesis protein NfuA
MDELHQKVVAALNSIRPYLVADGGDIELVEITNDYKVYVRLMGACSSCDCKTQTLHGGVESVVKKAVPEIVSVEAINR